MKIALIGTGPLPTQSNQIANAGGLRTQQFIDGLATNEQTTVASLLIQNSGLTVLNTEENEATASVKTVAKDDPQLGKIVREFCHGVDAVIAVNTFPALIAAQQIDDKTPLWADLNGWVMAEAQAQAWANDDNARLAAAWQMERQILLRADRLSVCSSPQMHTVYGELATLGRLHRDSFGVELVSVIQNANREFAMRASDKGGLGGSSELGNNAELVDGGLVQNLVPRTPQPPLSEGLSSRLNFTVLWLGGFNAWADEETFFTAGELAMAQNKSLRIIVTGEALTGIDEKSFLRFKARVASSKHHKRWELRGWVPAAEMPALFAEVDCGINVDKYCAETLIGARNRLNEYAKLGLPMISTAGAEIVDLLADGGALVRCPSGDAQAIADALLALTDDSQRCLALGAAGKALMAGEFAAHKQLRCIRQWLRDPQADKRLRSAYNLNNKWWRITAARHYLRRHGVSGFLKKCRQILTNKLR